MQKVRQHNQIEIASPIRGQRVSGKRSIAVINPPAAHWPWRPQELLSSQCPLRRLQALPLLLQFRKAHGRPLYRARRAAVRESCGDIGGDLLGHRRSEWLHRTSVLDPNWIVRRDDAPATRLLTSNVLCRFLEEERDHFRRSNRSRRPLPMANGDVPSSNMRALGVSEYWKPSLFKNLIAVRKSQRIRMPRDDAPARDATSSQVIGENQ